MKLKDYFVKLKDQAKITNEEFDKFIAAIPEGEIPDPIFQVIEDNFLTRERAKADNKIEAHFKALALNGVDEIIDEMLPSFHVFKAAEIKAEKNTYKKLAMLKEGHTEAIEKIRTEKPSNDEKVKAAEKALQEAAEKEKNNKLIYEQGLQQQKEELNKQLKQFKLNTALEKQIGKYKFADEFEQDRDGVTDVILNKIGKNVLDFNERGEILVFDVVDGVHKPKFNGNDPVTLDKLLEEAAKPYIKKSNGDGAEGQNNNGKERQIPLQTTQRQGARTVVKNMQNV
jgi:hypothetical protein